ncbi:hypothetical protein WJX64_03255 [Leifsonia sp. YIM 134122]|uniref:Uncharacterized protein n=1 Tax=Leifsonia stereocauli TaxID=3134136 RepID=A0ABU9W0P4_9MICO
MGDLGPRFRFHQPGRLGRVDQGRWDQPVPVVLVAGDLPTLIVDAEVTPAAQQDAVGDVGVAVVAFPMPDVMHFRPGGWSVAVGFQTSAVADADREALRSIEQSFVTAEVQRLPGRTEQHGQVAGAQPPFDGRQGDSAGVTLDGSEPGPGAQRLLVDDDPHRRGLRIEEAHRVDGCASPDQLDESFGSVAFPDGPVDERIPDRCCPEGTLLRVGLPAWVGQLVVDALQQGTVLRVQGVLTPVHAVGADPLPPVLLVPQCSLPDSDPGGVDEVSGCTGGVARFGHMHPVGAIRPEQLGEQCSQGRFEVVGGDRVGDLAETGLDHIGHSHGEPPRSDQDGQSGVPGGLDRRHHGGEVGVGVAGGGKVTSGIRHRDHLTHPRQRARFSLRRPRQ